MFDVNSLVESGGLLLIGLVVFAESALLIGFFLPGDTLLFTAGFLASQDKLPLAGLLVIIVAAAIIGDQVGYHIGKKSGPRIFKRKDGLFFRQEYLQRAETFYERHGGKTIILARFTPIVRTFAPIVAGVAKMPRNRFTFFNVIGALGWGISVTLLGYWLGSKVPNIDDYILPVVALAVILSFGPPLFHLAKDKKTRQVIREKLSIKRR
ncbi:MAG TPA: DedA family protein [Candidatus Saccharimonadales bacterium]|nr:DedA family protein [Candidatus Saccharimonadales bacterium]